MNFKKSSYIYGPVPSRRLGRSLGIDLVPYKVCSYDCIYCQLGRTTEKTIERKEYVPVDEVLNELERKLAGGDYPDYISLAGSGEPTLNSGIGDLIRGIKAMTDIPVAVLTNGSLLWMSEVQDALMPADLVLPSLDAGDDVLFRTINRPHGDIGFDRMVEGLVSFTKRFKGEVWLEVFLLAGLNASTPETKKIADIILRIAPDRVQLNTVARPPAEEIALPVPRTDLISLGELIHGRVEIISEYEQDKKHTEAFTGAREADILALLSRRPCTTNDVASGLGIHINEALKYINRLTTTGKISKVVSGKKEYYASAGPESESARPISAANADEAERYAKSCREDFWAQVFQSELSYILEHLKGCRDILSVGCGPAIIETGLSEHGFNVTGLDVSTEALQRAPDQIRTIVARAEEMPLQDASFDAVISITSIQFVDDYREAIREMARVLRSPGKIIIMLLNPDSAFFCAKLNEPDSYVRKIKHTDIKAVEDFLAGYFDVRTEYFLGIRDHEIFESSDPTNAALYVISGNKSTGTDTS